MAEYEAGGLTRRQFCMRQQLAYSSFFYERMRLSALAANIEQAEQLVELPMLRVQGYPDRRVELDLGQGV